jgi:hypothetical protein
MLITKHLLPLSVFLYESSHVHALNIIAQEQSRILGSWKDRQGREVPEICYVEPTGFRWNYQSWYLRTLIWKVEVDVYSRLCRLSIHNQCAISHEYRCYIADNRAVVDVGIFMEYDYITL